MIDNSPDRRQPVKQAHARVHRHLPPDEAPELLKRHFQIISVLWRLIGVPALESPLVLCDFRSVDPKNDVFPAALIYPETQEWMDTLHGAVKGISSHQHLVWNKPKKKKPKRCRWSSGRG